jgi:hypothetical protein
MLLSVLLLARAIVKAAVEWWRGGMKEGMHQTASCLLGLALAIAYHLSVGIGEGANAEVVLGKVRLGPRSSQKLPCRRVQVRALILEPKQSGRLFSIVRGMLRVVLE